MRLAGSDSRLRLQISEVRVHISVRARATAKRDRPCFPGQFPSRSTQDLLRDAEGGGVGLGGEDDGVGVAAADGDDEGDGQIAGGAHDHAVALFETSGSETEAAEAIGGERVDACLVEDEVWVEIRHLWKNGGEGAEVFVVGDAGVEFYVDGALLLAQREVGFAVNRDGEDGRVVAENVSGAVALVDIEIEDGDAVDAVFLEATRGD